jgi:hypothetical protein
VNPLGVLYIVMDSINTGSIATAQAATVPVSLPARCTNWSRLIGRVICKKTNATLYSVETVWATSFTLSAAVDHASLANITPMSTTGHPAATAAVDGYATATQITKLDGIAAGAQVNVLEGVTGTAPIVAGAVAAKSQAISIVAATTLVPGSMSSADKTKLDGIASGANLYVHPNHSGDVTSVADGAQTIAAGAVSLAKMANMATASVIYRKSAGAGAPEVNTIATLMADMLIEASTYTPSLTNVTNVAASSAVTCQYMRVGSVVTVSGSVSIDPTATGAAELGLSFPIASNIAAVNQCGGTFCHFATAGNVGGIYGDVTNDRARFLFNAVDTANRSYTFVFTYLIV